jgi:hypothetical protein
MLIKLKIINYQEGSGAGPLLLQLVGLPGWLGQDPPLGNEDNMLAAEFLLQFTHQPITKNN